MPDDSDVRIGDLDRQAALDRLATGLAEGRLDLEEHDQRIGAALAARTATELAVVTRDLPASAGDQRALVAERDRRDAQAWLLEWRSWLGGAVLMVGVWGVQSAADGALREFWPGVPLGIWAVVLLALAAWPAGPGGDEAEPGPG